MLAIAGFTCLRPHHPHTGFTRVSHGLAHVCPSPPHGFHTCFARVSHGFRTGFAHACCTVCECLRPSPPHGFTQVLRMFAACLRPSPTHGFHTGFARVSHGFHTGFARVSHMLVHGFRTVLRMGFAHVCYMLAPIIPARASHGQKSNRVEKNVFRQNPF